MNILVKNVKPYSKGALRAFFDLEMEGLLTIYGCTYFVKGESHWISMPSKQYKDKDGNDKYQPVVEMPAERLTKLRDLVMPQLKRELDNSPATKARDDPAFNQPMAERVEGGRAQLIREGREWVVPDDLDEMPF